MPAKLLRVLFIALFALLPLTVQAAPATAPADTKVTVDTESLKKLIETLESESARTEFISNLKALSTLEGEAAAAEPEAVPITKTLGIDTQTQALVGQYRTFLAKNNLNSSLLGKTALTGGVFLLAALFIAIIKKLSLALKTRLERLRQKFGIRHDRMRYYAALLRYVGYIGVLSLLMYTLTVIWNITGLSLLESETGSKILGHAVGIFVVVLVAILVWEIISGSIDYGLKRANSANAARMRTLLPIIKNVLFMVFTVLFALVILSEIGINILPLLAGAGIVGVAVGFGAQTMVKDFISGFTVVVEDLFHVGDVVGLANIRGVVEAITLRKVQLRDVNGTVHTIPYSAITTIENLTKDFSFFVADVSVAYREDPDKIVDIIQKVDASMRGEDVYDSVILEPIEIMGVDRLMDSGAVIRARYKTRPGQQWQVGREFNKRLKKMLIENGVETSVPQQVVVNRFEDDKAAKQAQHPANTGTPETK